MVGYVYDEASTLSSDDDKKAFKSFSIVLDVSGLLKNIYKVTSRQKEIKEEKGTGFLFLLDTLLIVWVEEIASLRLNKHLVHTLSWNSL